MSRNINTGAKTLFIQFRRWNQLTTTETLDSSTWHLNHACYLVQILYMKALALDLPSDVLICFILCSLIPIKQVQPTAFITSGFNTPDTFQPQEAIISGSKLGSIHINMLHTLSQNILVKFYISKILKCMIKNIYDKKSCIYTLLLKLVLHLNQPEIQFIVLLEFVSDEYLCCSSIRIYTIHIHFTFSTILLPVSSPWL
jgi:hypothetical protein